MADYYGFRPIKWYSTPSAWSQNEAWRQSRKAMVDTFSSASSIASSAFGDAWSNQISGTAQLAAKAALKRTQEATKAAFNKIV